MVEVLNGNMKEQKTFVACNVELEREADIKRGIFQRDSLRGLLFVLDMVPLTAILRRRH